MLALLVAEELLTPEFQGTEFQGTDLLSTANPLAPNYWSVPVRFDFLRDEERVPLEYDDAQTR